MYLIVMSEGYAEESKTLTDDMVLDLRDGAIRIYDIEDSHFREILALKIGKGRKVSVESWEDVPEA